MEMGRLLHVCTSTKTGTAKHEVRSANLLADYGMEGDAHAGGWHRQVSILAHEHIEYMRKKGLKLSPGAFGENLVIDGVSVDEIGAGTHLRIGPALLQMTQVGKVCHARCAIFHKTGECIMPRKGLFAQVLEGGEIHPGMAVDVVLRVERSTLQAAVITVSGRCSADHTIQTARPAVADLLRNELNARIAWTKVVPDEVSEIAKALEDFSERGVDVILTVGRTGPHLRDVTPEATRKVLDREFPGLAKKMRAASAAQTPNALLSRAVAGIRAATLIVNLCGSKEGSVENLRAILPIIPHAIKIIRKEGLHKGSNSGRTIRIENAN